MSVMWDELEFPTGKYHRTYPAPDNVVQWKTYSSLVGKDLIPENIVIDSSSIVGISRRSAGAACYRCLH